MRALCELFYLGAPRAALTPVGGGLTNRMWRLETARGVFAVKQMNRDFDRADDVEWFDRAFTLERAAFAAGVPMPRPIPVAATGRCLGELARSDGPPITVRVHEWADGVKLDNSVAYPGEIAARVGSILARIHALRMKSGVAKSEALRVFGDEHWRTALERLEDANSERAGELRTLAPVLHDLEAYVIAAQDDATPLLLSHRDSDAKNFMRTSAGELMLVDWDAAGPVNPRQDLANEALVWAGVHRDEPDAAVARAYVDAYRRAGGVAEAFRPTDLAELIAVRLGWLDFNFRRALGERIRDESDREYGWNVLGRNMGELPRFAGSLDRWVALLAT
ncbi:MAG: aminoglycoside phosphotransferase family protein [Chloroflexota bacterium]|nr:aminoglycoside phosphotransferase family protein [Chloroflexota bacterium]